MQATSGVYKNIVSAAKAAGRSYAVEWKLDIYSADGSTFVGSYGEDIIISGSISGEMFTTASVGGAKARQLKVELLSPTETIPRMAMLKPYFRISYEGATSEWLLKGIYFVDTRHTDSESGVLELHGYDSMLKTEQPYCPDGSGTWPRNMATVVSDICSDIGVSLASGTQITTEYDCQLDTTMTMREYLGYIAAAHAGVWAFNDVGELTLLPLVVTESVEDIGTQVQSLKTSPVFEGVGRVEIYATSDEYFAYPDEGTGRTITFDCPWGSEAMAQGVYKAIKNYVYSPYEAAGALVSPAVELGDGVTINGSVYGVYKQDIAFGSLLASEISAPADEEIDHEYHYISTEKRLARQVSKMSAELRVTATAITEKITGADGRISTIEHTLDGVVYSNNAGTTVINGSNITTGYISADRISGGTIDADDVTIKNLTVDSVDVSKLRVNGNPISASNPWDNAYHTNVYVAEVGSSGGELQLKSTSSGYTTLDPSGVTSVYGTNPAGYVSWNKIIEVAQGGGTSTAVFG